MPRCLKLTEKRYHSTLRAKRATFTFCLDKKFIKKCQKWSILASFWKPEACGQAVIPDRLVLIGQKWWKMPKFKREDFQTTVSLLVSGQPLFGFSLCLHYSFLPSKASSIQIRIMRFWLQDDNISFAFMSSRMHLKYLLQELKMHK